MSTWTWIDAWPLDQDWPVGAAQEIAECFERSDILWVAAPTIHEDARDLLLEQIQAAYPNSAILRSCQDGLEWFTTDRVDAWLAALDEQGPVVLVSGSGVADGLGALPGWLRSSGSPLADRVIQALMRRTSLAAHVIRAHGVPFTGLFVGGSVYHSGEWTTGMKR